MALSANLVVDTASVGGDGNSESSSEILTTLREIRDVLTRQQKLEQTGFINPMTAGGGGGLLGALGKLLGGSGAGMLALGAIPFAIPGDEQQKKGYEQGTLPNGEQVYFEIDQKTGEILRTLTQQQAQDEGILDNKNRIKIEVTNHNKQWQEITKNAAKYKDSLILTTANIERLMVETDKQASIARAITEAMARQAARLGVKKGSYSNGRQQYTDESGSVTLGYEDDLTQSSYIGSTPPTGSMNYTPVPINNQRPYSSLRDTEANFSSVEAQRNLRNYTPIVDTTAYTSVVR